MKRVLVAALILAGCTTTERVWVRPNASQESFKRDAAQCSAQASSAPGSPAMQATTAYNSCMHNKGWYIEERRIVEYPW